MVVPTLFFPRKLLFARLKGGRSLFQFHSRSLAFLPSTAFIGPTGRRAILISIPWSFPRSSPLTTSIRPTERRAILISTPWSFLRSSPLENFYSPDWKEGTPYSSFIVVPSLFSPRKLLFARPQNRRVDISYLRFNSREYSAAPVLPGDFLSPGQRPPHPASVPQHPPRPVGHPFCSPPFSCASSPARADVIRF